MKSGKMLLLIIILAAVILAVYLISNANSITSNAVREPDLGIKVYFCPEEMCKEKLLELINESKEIKCAFYELNLEDVIKALTEKNAEVVIEDTNKLDGFYSGYSFALMHNKFCIFDNHIVFTGSMNPTANDNFLNNNNIVIIDSKALAENYLDEFSELKNNIYGRGSKVKHPIIYLGETEIESYFCPEDNCKLQVINALKQTNASIYFMTFSFTDEDIGNLVWNKQHLGLDVKGIFDDSQISDYSRYDDLKGFSMIDLSKYKLHHKVFIIDNSTVITGSFNPTQNANEMNDENLVIIHDRKIAEKFIQEFISLHNIDKTLPSKAGQLFISRIIYNAKGSDEGKEIVELSNNGPDVLLDYYYLTDNKTSMRLNGTINSNRSLELKPTFSLKNTNGLLMLKHNSKVIDFVFWEGAWNLSAKEGGMLMRIDNSVSSAAWITS